MENPGQATIKLLWRNKQKARAQSSGNDLNEKASWQ